MKTKKATLIIILFTIFNGCLFSSEKTCGRGVDQFIGFIDELLPDLAQGYREIELKTGLYLPKRYGKFYNFGILETTLSNKNKEILVGFVEFTPDGYIHQVEFNGEYVNARELDILQQKIVELEEKNKNWEKEFPAQVNGKKIRFGPYQKNLILQRIAEYIPLLEGILGFKPGKYEAIFDWRKIWDNRDERKLFWKIYFPEKRTYNIKGKLKTVNWSALTLILEPFDGRIIIIFNNTVSSVIVNGQ